MGTTAREDGGVKKKRPGDKKVDAYIPKLIAAFEAGAIPPGSVGEALILHDDWCAIYEGGRCDCNPEIHMISRDT